MPKGKKRKSDWLETKGRDERAKRSALEGTSKGRGERAKRSALEGTSEGRGERAKRSALEGTSEGGLAPLEAVQRAAVAPKRNLQELMEKYGFGNFHRLLGPGDYAHEYMTQDTGDLDYEGIRRLGLVEFREGTDEAGEAHGCHSCGKYVGQKAPPNPNTGARALHWVPDHQPPLSMGTKLGVTEYRVYPQCLECSIAQKGKGGHFAKAAMKAGYDSGEILDFVMGKGEGGGRPRRQRKPPTTYRSFRGRDSTLTVRNPQSGRLISRKYAESRGILSGI